MTQLSTRDYYHFLQRQGCSFFAGVPDSLLKAFCSCIKDQVSAENFWITANEGAAVAMAIGQYLATGKVPLVYLQNSGLGNALNPIVSMADPLVYGIPMLLLIGWRGELGQGQQETGEQLKDEPQHRQQGRITLAWLQASGIPYEILPCEQQAAEATTGRLLERAKAEQRPVAIVVRKETFADYQMPSSPQKNLCQDSSNESAPARKLQREEAIGLLLDKLPQGPIVSTTGMISRELFEQRIQRSEGHDKDFLVVGAMGHASAIAQGLALALWQRAPNRAQAKPVYCLDGDGALLMHMGSLAICGLGSRTGSNSPSSLLPNFKHIVLNNGCHGSVGGQPTVALELDIPAVATACGYRWAARFDYGGSLSELEQLLLQLSRAEGPALLEIQVASGARKDLGRPTLSSSEIKAQYQAYLATL